MYFAILNEFHRYCAGIYHCLRCHRVVRTYEIDDPEAEAAALAGHIAFNCTSDPYLGIASSAGRQ